MKRIALKIDVGSYHGTLNGVPALVDLLRRQGAAASFFFSFGPDRGGRESRRLSPAKYHDRLSRLYGLLLPAPRIGVRCVDSMRQARDCGFEVAVHAWDRVRWETRLPTADKAWIEAEMTQACRRFSDIFGEQPYAWAAPGWRTNRHALRLTQRLGFCYASDCRGTSPFIPVIDGEIVLCPQLPTTLPTIDELLATGSTSVEEAVEQLVEEPSRVAGDHVFTLRAELEGMCFLAAFERLLIAWKTRDHELLTLRELIGSRNIVTLPRHEVVFTGVPGRPGQRMVQGKIFLPPE